MSLHVHYLFLLLSITSVNQGQETGCPELSLANGRISYSPSSYRTSTGIPKPVGTVVTRYRCDSGYTLFGQVSNRICQCDGTWSGPVSAVSCRIATGCGPPPSIPNGSHGTPTSTAIGGSVLYTCNPGYVISSSIYYYTFRIRTSRRVTCSSSGRWSPPSCTLPPVYLSLGSTVFFRYNFEININSIGESNDQALVCHTTATWCCEEFDESSPGSTCINKGFGEWLDPDGRVVIQSEDVPTGTSSLFYKSRGPQLIRLHRRGSTSSQTGSYCCKIPQVSSSGITVTHRTLCANLVDAPVEEVTAITTLNPGEFCGPPPSIQNGYVCPRLPTSTMVRGTVTYCCNRGYIHSGSATVTCLSTDRWSVRPFCLYRSTHSVYLSLSSTNYLSGFPEIPLSSIGEGRGNSLVCHTDSFVCCRQLDSGVEGGVGEWYYPNGSAVSANSARDALYVSREQGSVNLNYRSGAKTTSGIYCCVVPTSQGTLYQCAVIVSLGSTQYSLPRSPNTVSIPQTTERFPGSLNTVSIPQTPGRFPGSQITSTCLQIAEISPHPKCDNTGTVVGGVVAAIATLSICLIITYLIIRDKRRGKRSITPNDPPISNIGQSSAPTYETVPGAYEEVEIPVEDDLSCTHNQAYMSTARTTTLV